MSSFVSELKNMRNHYASPSSFQNMGLLTLSVIRISSVVIHVMLNTFMELHNVAFRGQTGIWWWVPPKYIIPNPFVKASTRHSIHEKYPASYNLWTREKFSSQPKPVQSMCLEDFPVHCVHNIRVLTALCNEDGLLPGHAADHCIMGWGSQPVPAVKSGIHAGNDPRHEGDSLRTAKKSESASPVSCCRSESMNHPMSSTHTEQSGLTY